MHLSVVLKRIFFKFDFKPNTSITSIITISQTPSSKVDLMHGLNQQSSFTVTLEQQHTMLTYHLMLCCVQFKVTWVIRNPHVTNTNSTVSAIMKERKKEVCIIN